MAMTENVTATKGIFALTAGLIGYLYDCLNELVIVLFIFILMDYVLGILQCFKEKNQFDKELALWGIVKKVLYGFVLAIAFLVDYIIVYFTTKVGIKLPVASIFGIAALAYLLGTEGFSVGKHFIALGVPAPDFILQFFGMLRDQSGKIIKIPEDVPNE